MQWWTRYYLWLRMSEMLQYSEIIKVGLLFKDNFDFSEPTILGLERNVPWAGQHWQQPTPGAKNGQNCVRLVGNNNTLSCEMVRAANSAELMMKYEHSLMIFLNRDRVL